MNQISVPLTAGAAAALLAILVVPVSARADSAPAARVVAASSAEFAKPHQLVDVGGRRMNLYCSGSGAVTVIFDSPSGDAGWIWHQVQPEVAKQTRACVYDRAGFGFSDSASRPNTSQNAVDDLHKLLAGGNVKPPYVLVGNSLGGANVQVYAYRYPKEVAGLVLVEAQHEDETKRLNAITQGKIGQFYAMQKEQIKFCLMASSKGFKPDSEALQNCVGDPSQVYGKELGAAVFASTSTPAYWRANAAEYNAIDTSDKQLGRLRRPFGNLPIVVLTRGVSPYAIPGQPQSPMNKATEDENFAIQKQMADLSTRGTQRVVAGAGHVIEIDKPQAVVDAVLDVLKQLK
jgi:pimeloyl-ACP methyl ester carboxylesterase